MGQIDVYGFLKKNPDKWNKKIIKRQDSDGNTCHSRRYKAHIKLPPDSRIFINTAG